MFLTPPVAPSDGLPFNVWQGILCSRRFLFLFFFFHSANLLGKDRASTIPSDASTTDGNKILDGLDYFDRKSKHVEGNYTDVMKDIGEL
jgi:hypothetical protein